LSLPFGYCRSNLTNTSSSSQDPEASGEIPTQIQVRCTTCYLKGTVITHLSIQDDFNTSKILPSIASQVGDEISDIAQAALGNFDRYLDNIGNEIKAGTFSLDDLTLDNYTVPLDFNLDLPPLPECQFSVRFDGLELYMLLDTATSGPATIELPLYQSRSPLGLSLSRDLQVGVFLTLDLILSIDGALSLQSGIHIQLDDGIAIKLSLFARDIENLDLYTNIPAHPKPSTDQINTPPTAPAAPSSSSQ